MLIFTKHNKHEGPYFDHISNTEKIEERTSKCLEMRSNTVSH